MFIFSFKTSKKQILSLIVAIFVLIIIIIAFAMWPANADTVAGNDKIGSNSSERITFLSGLGYQVDATQEESKDVLIPAEFDDVFNSFNELQRQVNMDFEPYQGKRVTCWTYKVVNMPDKGEVFAHLYLYRDKIIAGDISSTAIDGFMFPLISHFDAMKALNGGEESDNTTQSKESKEEEKNETKSEKSDNKDDDDDDDDDDD